MTTISSAFQFQLGAAIVTVINAGHLQLDLAASLNVTKTEWSARYPPFFEQPLSLPMQCVHLQLPTTSILVDATTYDLSPDSLFAIPGYQPPSDLWVQLTEIGIHPQEIAHVIITHAHFDHFNGTTVKRDGQYEPSFLNARYYLGRADWEHVEPQDALVNRTLAVLNQQGVLELVDGDRNVAPGVCIMAAPGETPGHQLVRLNSEGQVLYCLGDLYHHPVEVEQPTWMTHWADPEACAASRQALVESALAENALLVATHIPTIGRLQRTGSGVVWVEVFPKYERTQR